METVSEKDATQPGATASGRVVVREAPHNAETPLEALAEQLTPTDQHYVRSNFPEPRLSPEHRIQVAGALLSPRALGLADLKALGTRTIAVTMECAGNNRLGMAPLPSGEPWDLGAVGTATWTGAPLRQVLEVAGLRDDVTELVVVGADRGKVEGEAEEIPFARALPREAALDPEALLAWEMNGAPLTQEHGAPVRLIVPGWYGMASVKWVARLEARVAPFTGHFQTARYVYRDRQGAVTPVTRMRVKSLVTSPREGLVVPAGTVRIEGWAWSGAGGITSVEVSVDGGPWVRAQLGEQRSRHVWRGFRLDVPLTRRGRHTVRSRATDESPATQPDAPPWNALGYGNNAVAVRRFDVR